jgi:tryptophan-rich hypothetical protein
MTSSLTDHYLLMSISPKKLLLSKWTALAPVKREKHFLVTRVLVPDDGSPIVDVELQAVHSQRAQIMPWRALQDTTVWTIGWQ